MDSVLTKTTKLPIAEGQMKNKEDSCLIFEISQKGNKGCFYPNTEIENKTVDELIPSHLQRKSSNSLPEVSEPEIVRHYTKLSQKNFAIDTHFYPLGSCTMKYNPRMTEKVAAMPFVADAHPYQDPDTIQPLLSCIYEAEEMLKEITGMERFTFQPAAGAHGEYLGLQLIMAYHHHHNDFKRKKVIVPDSSHGTNPATATLCGCEVVEIPSNKEGLVDIEALEKVLNEETACLMLTNPNTLGLFEKEILKVSKMVHEAGGFLYYDGANMNALFDVARPGDMGFDVMHLNLHKSFSTPHGGGGPGAGPVGVNKRLVDYLPYPLISQGADQKYYLDNDIPHSIGKIKSFYGNVGVVIRAYTYMRLHGKEGLRQVSRDAILNANYLMHHLKDLFEVAYPGTCMHEFVLTTKNPKWKGIHSIDIGKRLLDYGYHAPTVAFPLIVPEALMIEPTETESKVTLDGFIEAMQKIREELDHDPDVIRKAPLTLPIKRCDEVGAARNPNLKFQG